MDRRFVLVTGLPRSGTTGVGTALAHAPRAAALYEPLNAESGLRSVTDYFVLPPGAALTSDAYVRSLLDQVRSLSVRTRSGVWPHDPRWKRWVKPVTGSTTRVSAARIRLDPRVRTVIWKDPFAALLAPGLAAQQGVPVVVTIRPPEAVAASFKRLAWDFDVPRVVRGLERVHGGASYLEGMSREYEKGRSSVSVAAQLWRLVYGYLHHATPKPGAGGTGAETIWVNPRALLADPLATYEDLYGRLGMELTERGRRAIERDYRDEGSGVPAPGVTHDARRNVQAANSYWSSVLDPDELAVVRGLTDEVRAQVETRTGDLA